MGWCRTGRVGCRGSLPVEKRVYDSALYRPFCANIRSIQRFEQTLPGRLVQVACQRPQQAGVNGCAWLLLDSLVGYRWLAARQVSAGMNVDGAQQRGAGDAQVAQVFDRCYRDPRTIASSSDR